MVLPLQHLVKKTAYETPFFYCFLHHSVNSSLLDPNYSAPSSLTLEMSHEDHIQMFALRVKKGLSSAKHSAHLEHCHGNRLQALGKPSKVSRQVFALHNVKAREVK
jgi:hypothetical protein